MSADRVSYLVSRRAAVVIRMRGFINRAEISFGFDDHSRNSFARFGRNNQQFADQILRDLQSVVARGKIRVKVFSY